MKTNETLRGIIKLMDAAENGSYCPMLNYCHDFLTPDAYYECLDKKNPCPKHEMVRNQILFEILHSLRGINESLQNIKEN